MTENQKEDRNTESQSNTSIQKGGRLPQNGRATTARLVAVRFAPPVSAGRAGDTLVVLLGEEIQFHGLIGRIDDGWAIASDRRGSLLPAMVQ
jgi:hypothetical protein